MSFQLLQNDPTSKWLERAGSMSTNSDDVGSLATFNDRVGFSTFIRNGGTTSMFLPRSSRVHNVVADRRASRNKAVKMLDGPELLWFHAAKCPTDLIYACWILLYPRIRSPICLWDSGGLLHWKSKDVDRCGRQSSHIIHPSARAFGLFRQAGDPAKRKDYLPKDKQYLMTRNGEQGSLSILHGFRSWLAPGVCVCWGCCIILEVAAWEVAV